MPCSEVKQEMNASTAEDWNSYLGEVCENTIILNPTVIGGPEKTVEIDESIFAPQSTENDTEGKQTIRWPGKLYRCYKNDTDTEKMI